MASPHRQYTNELYDRFGYIATWLPGIPLKLGDVGTMGPNGFTRASNLGEPGFGIPFRIRQDRSPTDYQYSSEGAVSVSFHAAAGAPALGQLASNVSGSVTVEMSRANAVLFVAREARSPSIENQDELGRAILELHAAGKWPEDYFVITELLEADCGTILISSSQDCRIDIAASGDASLAALELANSQLGLRVQSSRNVHTQIVAKAGLTPLFKARRVQRRLLGLGRTFFRSLPTPEVAELSPADLSYEE